MFYHVQIEVKAGGKQKRKEFLLDLTEAEAKSEFIDSYKAGKGVQLNGKNISSRRIDKLTVCWSDRNSAELIQEYKAEAARAKPWMLLYEAFERVLDRSDGKQEYLQ